MRILTCSNSCPRWDGGVLAPRSPGGLVPMLVALLRQHGGHWIFTAPPDVVPSVTGQLIPVGVGFTQPLPVHAEAAGSLATYTALSAFAPLAGFGAQAVTFQPFAPPPETVSVAVRSACWSKPFSVTVVLTLVDAVMAIAPNPLAGTISATSATSEAAFTAPTPPRP